ncbi:hypothetical protein [Azospirillum halopraeferens]|uniref:hypothetical protein n=1 Tax=Azospirillum halopraeferens TaxID=34010 RepID=UPI0004055F3A|nr:hypothetical protein [Azospirillum halopraeferens]
MDPIFGLAPWVVNLIAALYLTYKLVLAGWIVAKAGRSPLWGLMVLVPFAELLGIWLFAYARWPFMERPDSGAAEEPAGRA